MNHRIVVLALIALSGCVSREEDPKSPLAGGCILNSDCEEGLVCVFRLCHEPCTAPRDCPTGSNCQLAGDPAQLVCSLIDCTNGPCPEGQICGADRECRFECTTNAGCASGQVCIENQCEWIEKLSGDAGLPPPVTSHSCRTNSECAADAGVCRFGSCGPECLNARDCAIGFSCQSGLCVIGGSIDDAGVNGCEYNSNCQAPQVCASFGPKAGTCVDECIENRDCQISVGPSYICESGACVRAPIVTVDGGTSMACTYSSNCGPRERCAQGTCIPECLENQDCSFGFVCMNNGCVAPTSSDAGTIISGCSYNSQCGDNQRCSPQGVCIPECLANRDCNENAGQCCRSNACVAGDACFTITDAGTFNPDAGFQLDGGPSLVPIGGVCSVNIQCIDGDFCNGTEACVNNRCARGSMPCDDGNPCTLDQCSSTSLSCSYQTIATDVDGDGHFPRACGGTADDCDDSDAFTFAGAIERCDWKDNNCNGQVDENLWREVPGSRSPVSTGAQWDMQLGAPVAKKLGNDIIVSASGYLVTNTTDAWRLDATTLSTISGPVALATATSAWSFCSNNAGGGPPWNSKQSGRQQLEVSDAGFLFTAINNRFNNPVSTCCQGDSRTTSSVWARFDAPLTSISRGVLLDRTEVNGCSDMDVPQFQATQRARVAWDGARQRWLTVYWGRDSLAGGYLLRASSIEADGGVTPERLVYGGTAAAAKSYQASGTTDGDPFVAIGTNSIIYAWTNEPVTPYATRYVRWVMYDSTGTTQIAGPFDTALLTSAGGLTGVVHTRIDSLTFDGSNYVMIMTPHIGSAGSGLNQAQLVTIGETGQLVGTRRYLAAVSNSATGAAYGSGVRSAFAFSPGGLVMGTQEGLSMRFRYIPSQVDAGTNTVDVYMGSVQETRSDLALVPIDAMSTAAFWVEGKDVWKTKISCVP